MEDKSREERIELTRYELRRHLRQIKKSNLGNFEPPPSADYRTRPLPDTPPRHAPPACHERVVRPHACIAAKCQLPALPCTQYCSFHIMRSADQVLFHHCTAKFADNTQCSTPVFDMAHELPLCAEHARKRDNYHRLYQEANKPKKLRKKIKPSAMIRPQKRGKKKRKPAVGRERNNRKGGPRLCVGRNSTGCVLDVVVAQVEVGQAPELVEQMVDEVLVLPEPDDTLELVSVEQALVTQASTLLEESEINNVLSTIQADEFNDFFMGKCQFVATPPTP